MLVNAIQSAEHQTSTDFAEPDKSLQLNVPGSHQCEGDVDEIENAGALRFGNAYALPIVDMPKEGLCVACVNFSGAVIPAQTGIQLSADYPRSLLISLSLNWTSTSVSTPR
jgi:uncharacterized membrane protein